MSTSSSDINALENAINNNNNTSNNLAAAAAALAAAAFIVAFLQVILEYVKSGDAIHKCAKSAIGPLSKHVRYRWSFKSWKIKVYYPDIDFSQATVFDAARTNAQTNVDSSELSYFGRELGYRWRVTSRHDIITQSTISDGMNALFKGTGQGELVKAKELNWKMWMEFWKWRMKHPLKEVIRPRATWSQMLLAFGIRDTRKTDLVIRRVDADTIPGNIDVPIQRVKFFELGILAFGLGFKSVSIDVDARHFHAVGPFGTISTIEVQTLGKVLRFEGDVFVINYTIGRTHPYQVWISGFLNNGISTFGDYRSNGIIMPLHTIVDAIRFGWTIDKFREEQKQYISDADDMGVCPGHLPREAARFAEILQRRLTIEASKATGVSENKIASALASLQVQHAQKTGGKTLLDAFMADFDSDESQAIIKKCIRAWQDEMRLYRPSMLIAATFANMCTISTGYPSRIQLEPIIPWLRYEAAQLVKRRDKSFFVSKMLRLKMADGSIPWLREESHFLMSNGTGSNYDGFMSWSVADFRELYDELPEEIQTELFVTPKGATDTEPIGLLVPDTYRLLQAYSPKSWADQVLENQRLVPGKGFYPENLIWMQVCLLDMAIRLMIRGGLEKIDDAGNAKRKPRTLSRQDTMEMPMEEILADDRADNEWTDSDAMMAYAITRGWKLDDDEEADAKSKKSTHSRHNSGINEKVNGDAQDRPIEASGTNKQDFAWTETPLQSESPKEETPNEEQIEQVQDPATEPPLKPITPASTFDKNVESEPHDRILAHDIRKFAGLRKQGTNEEKERFYSKLADLLKLRGIFLLAFYLAGPDSTDVYLAEGSKAEMPMI